MDTENIYRKRFNKKDLFIKNNIWKILCQKFFQRFIDKEDVVLDLGAGYCEFINNIISKKKYAIDSNNDVKDFASGSVEVLVSDIRKSINIDPDSIDVIFISNFFEHLDSKEDIVSILKESSKLLRKNGRILILQPNIKYCYKEYWDFFDHKIPLSDKSLEEVLRLTNFKVKLSISRFLPFTTKNRLPKNKFFIRIYLSLPILWKMFGKQAFILAEKTTNDSL